MASNASSVVKVISAFCDQTFSPAAMSAHLAAMARAALAEAQRSGQAPAGPYITVVDGVVGASEDTVRPNGQIVYLFALLGMAVSRGLAYVMARSPVDSGRFRRSWVVLVDWKPWKGQLEDIPARSTVILTNYAEYSRKVEVGGMRMSVPPKILEGARQRLMSAFKTLEIEPSFVELTGGVSEDDTEVPYILRGRSRSMAKRYAHHLVYRKVKTIAVNRSDSSAGKRLTYPALIIKERR